MSMAGNKSLFECCVCYSFYNLDYRKPKYLMCHHTVCLDCICKTMDSSLLQVRCPLCREKTTIQSEDIDKALRTNQDILAFMEIWIYKLKNNIDSPLPRHDENINQDSTSITSKTFKWCRDCQELAFDTCHNDNHCTMLVSPTNLKFAQEALAQARESQLNWEKAISKRNDLRTIATLIQSSVNRMKERIDVLVDENDRALLAMRELFEGIKQSINSLDPMCSDVDLKGFAKQKNLSENDLKIATEILETFSFFDKAPVQVLIEPNNQKCGMLNGIIHWNEDTILKETKRDNGMMESETNGIFLLDALRSIGYFVASVPLIQLPTRPARTTTPRRRTRTSATVLNSQPSPDDPQSPPPSQPLLATPVNEVSVIAFPPINECTSTCAWNPTENILASTRKNESVCLNFGSRQSDFTPLLLEGINQTSGGQTHRLAWNSKGTQLVTGSKDGWISFWTSSGTNLYRQKQHNGEILAMKWSNEGKFVATGGCDTLVKIWNAVGQNCVQNFTYHKSAVSDFEWQSENTFASCDMSGKMFFGDIRLVDRPQFAYTGHQGWVKCLQWDPERLLLASCSSDSTVKIWTPFVPPFLQEYTSHTMSVNAVQWSPLGSIRYLASCSDDQTAHILDINRQAVVHRLETTKTKPSKMTCLSFSFDGRLLATGNENGVVEIWDVHNGRIQNYKNFESCINKIAWQNNGTKLGIAINNKSCKIVDLKYIKERR